MLHLLLGLNVKNPGPKEGVIFLGPILGIHPWYISLSRMIEMKAKGGEGGD